MKQPVELSAVHVTSVPITKPRRMRNLRVAAESKLTRGRQWERASLHRSQTSRPMPGTTIIGRTSHADSTGLFVLSTGGMVGLEGNLPIPSTALDLRIFHSPRRSVKRDVWLSKPPLSPISAV